VEHAHRPTNDDDSTRLRGSADEGSLTADDDR
jgi:hypothetical protein